MSRTALLILGHRTEPPCSFESFWCPLFCLQFGDGAGSGAIDKDEVAQIGANLGLGWG
eukprot:SAG31_NODE_29900_length_388_cov_0.896194_1_plen_57_part_01